MLFELPKRSAPGALVAIVAVTAAAASESRFVRWKSVVHV
jgi:hypothetical protein